jgi:5-methyltetrahydrofolate--homocysteine methyltransferase
MTRRSPSRPFRARAVTLLDGAMGTALRRQGLPVESFPEEWLLARPAKIAAVHAGHARAGARILLTCTFNCTAPRLRTRGLEDQAEALCSAAARLARSAGQGLLVAGAVGPTTLVGPGRRPSPKELRAHYLRPFRALAAAGVDLLWAETQYDLKEARAALAAGLAVGLPTLVTLALVPKPSGMVLHSGEPALSCLAALERDGAAAVGAGCDLPGAPLAELLARFAVESRIPLVAKPSAGLPGERLSPARFAAWGMELVRSGAVLVGGCCGTTAAHLRALADRIADQ